MKKANECFYVVNDLNEIIEAVNDYGFNYTKAFNENMTYEEYMVTENRTTGDPENIASFANGEFPKVIYTSIRMAYSKLYVHIDAVSLSKLKD